jgi:hypothetical protein
LVASCQWPWCLPSLCPKEGWGLPAARGPLSCSSLYTCTLSDKPQQTGLGRRHESVVSRQNFRQHTRQMRISLGHSTARSGSSKQCCQEESCAPLVPLNRSILPDITYVMADPNTPTWLQESSGGPPPSSMVGTEEPGVLGASSATVPSITTGGGAGAAPAASVAGGSATAAAATAAEEAELPGIILIMRLANMGVAAAMIACSVRFLPFKPMRAKQPATRVAAVVSPFNFLVDLATVHTPTGHTAKQGSSLSFSPLFYPQCRVSCDSNSCSFLLRRFRSCS